MAIVTLVSGGIDSTVMSLLAQEEGIKLFPLFVNYGQRSARLEWFACQHVHARFGLPTVERVDLCDFGRLVSSGLTDPKQHVYEDAFQPGRNLLLLVAGAAYAVEVGADGVALGLLDPGRRLFDDQTEEFVNRAEDAIRLSVGRSVSVLAPLIGCSKRDVLRLARERGVSKTYSCHAGEEEVCGGCIACREIADAKREGED
ncbi:MAG: 7-cyano-7-deazaguanine synthase [Gemmatimonadota bacterium]|uniref:7-cyano-7-deazaguanine synthase n=1 Tax=Candidatus Palauibacter scopulicola TaxID=3056741 RepID=UPI0023A623A4|nr:7-cyano-7-deazaguanine synthase [Candidatus Palauibacter scopulicola]